MSVLDDAGAALSGPFISWANTFKTLFTNPGKLKAKDIPTLLLPIPGAGSTITYDIDHPSAALYQGSALAILSGGAAAFGPSAGAPAAHAPLFNEAGFAVGDLTPRAVPTLALSPQPGVFTAEAAAWRAPNAVELAAQRGVTAPGEATSFLSTLKTGAGDAYTFVSKGLELAKTGAALKGALGPAAAALSGGQGGGGSASTRAVPVAAGGGNLSPSSSSPFRAAASSLVVPVVFGFAALAVGYYLLKGKLRHA